MEDNRTGGRLLTVKEVASILGIEASGTIYTYIYQRKLKAFKIGSPPNKKYRNNHHRWRIWESDLKEFIDKVGNMPQPKPEEAVITKND
jgi:predicted DNA-binding transcriptional regulator AlpA